MTKKKILVLGDSLTLSRRTPELCRHETTWPVKLRMQYEVHQVSIGGGTIRDIHRQIEYHKEFAPDYVILQCGIVDCAPRALTQFELEFIKRLWGVRRLMFWLINQNNYALRKYRGVTYTSPTEFESYFKKIQQAFKESKIYSIGILPAFRDYEKTVPGIGKRIEQYNKILRDQAGSDFISCSEISLDCVMNDNIHLTEQGHDFVFRKIIDAIK